MRILQEIHPLHLIREVEKWPVLYEKDGPERANAHLKHKMWLEVSKALFDDWDSYTKPVKELKVQELTRKWRNLRDTFRRHVEIEKKMREGDGAGGAGAGGAGSNKRKKYVYFKHMLFLLPHLAPAGEPDEPLPELDRYLAAAAPRASPRRKRRRRSPSPPAPAPTPAPADEVAIDEDKHFLLSLVPSFKRMSEDEKLSAKMEILKVIREVKSRGRAPRPRPVDALAPPVPAPAPATSLGDTLKLEFYSVDDAEPEYDSERNSD